MLSESQRITPTERVCVETDETHGRRAVKIRVEGFDEQLGWYSSGSLTLGIEQLPLLEQAVAEMRQIERNRTEHVCEIIPFPILTEQLVAQVAQ